MLLHLIEFISRHNASYRAHSTCVVLTYQAWATIMMFSRYMPMDCQQKLFTIREHLTNENFPRKPSPWLKLGCQIKSMSKYFIFHPFSCKLPPNSIFRLTTFLHSETSFYHKSCVLSLIPRDHNLSKLHSERQKIEHS